MAGAPAGTTSRRVRNSALTRARIEKEALRLFAHKGVDGATIRDLSQAVGVADAALYRYYKSKEEIAAGIFTRHYGELARAVRKVRERQLGFAPTVRELVLLFCRLFDESPDVFAFILLNQHAHLRYVKADENVVEEICAIMTRACERREIGVADPNLAAAMALGAVLQPAVFKLYGRLPGPLSAHVATITQAAIKAVGGGPI